MTDGDDKDKPLDDTEAPIEDEWSNDQGEKPQT